MVKYVKLNFKQIHFIFFLIIFKLVNRLIQQKKNWENKLTYILTLLISEYKCKHINHWNLKIWAYWNCVCFILNKLFFATINEPL